MTLSVTPLGLFLFATAPLAATAYFFDGFLVLRIRLELVRGVILSLDLLEDLEFVGIDFCTLPDDVDVVHQVARPDFIFICTLTNQVLNCRLLAHQFVAESDGFQFQINATPKESKAILKDLSVDFVELVLHVV